MFAEKNSWISWSEYKYLSLAYIYLQARPSEGAFSLNWISEPFFRRNFVPFSFREDRNSEGKRPRDLSQPDLLIQFPFHFLLKNDLSISTRFSPYQQNLEKRRIRFHSSIRQPFMMSKRGFSEWLQHYTYSFLLGKNSHNLKWISNIEVTFSMPTYNF